MKKITLIQLFVILLTMLILVPVSAESLLLKYDFNGGASTASYIAEGVISSGLGRKGTNAGLNYTLSTKESRECLAITTTLGITAADYVYIPIGAADGKMVQVTKTVITHRKATGNTTTGNARSYLYSSLTATSSTNNLIYWGPPNFGGYPLGNNTSWQINQEFVTKVNPGVETPFNISTTQYAAFGFANASGGTGEWWIDEVAYYGTVFTEGEIIVANSLDFGDENVVSLPKLDSLSLNGYNVTNDVTITVEGTDADMFELTKSLFTAAEVNAGTKIYVTYTPTSVNAHTAQLRLTYGEKEAQVSLKGSVAIVKETFDKEGADYGSLTNLDDYTVLPGWTMENVSNWYSSGLYAYTPALSSSLGTVASYSTPQLDLSKPYKIYFLGRNNAANGLSCILAGQDTISYYSFPSNYTFAPYTIDGFVAADNTRITFSAVGINNNSVLFDNILISNSSSPTVSLPLRGRQDFGNVLPNSTRTIGIQIKAYNLTGDLTVTAPVSSDFELLSSTTISKASAEAGTEISVRFKPTDTLNYEDVIQVSGGGLPSGSSVRTVYLLGAGDVGTHVNDAKVECKLAVENNILNIKTDGAANLEIFSFNGMLVHEKSFINNTETMLTRGAYIVRINTEQGVSVQKIIVQ